MRKGPCIVGVDEVGRGPLAGPVALCACAAPEGFDFALLNGIKDSKKLSAQKREEWFAKLVAWKSEGVLDFTYADVSAAEIDVHGIAPAIRTALARCLEALNLDPDTAQVMLDGSLKAPKQYLNQETIIKGDEKVPIISAASIVAKVTRDRYMEEQARVYSEYGFDRHKGYGTAEHLLAIRKHGPSPIHRKTFLGNLLSTAR